MLNFKKTRIPLFRRFVIQNFPFIEQDFDALTDYELISKVVEYLNEVIVSTNANSEQVEILTNYFDNLDLHGEIDTIMKEYIDAGTFYETLNYDSTTQSLTLTFDMARS